MDKNKHMNKNVKKLGTKKKNNQPISNLSESEVATTSTTSNSSNTIGNIFASKYTIPKKKVYTNNNVKTVTQQLNGQSKNCFQNNCPSSNSANIKIYTKTQIKKGKNQVLNTYKNINLNQYSRSNSQLIMEPTVMNKIVQTEGNNVNNRSQVYSQNILLTNKTDVNHSFKKLIKVNKRNNSLLLNNSNNNNIFTSDTITKINDYSTLNKVYQKNKSVGNYNNVLSQNEIKQNHILEPTNYNTVNKGNYNDIKNEKTEILNIEELLLIEEKLSSIKECIQNETPCDDECFEWINTYFNTDFSKLILKYFVSAENSLLIKRVSNLIIYSIMLCYDISFNRHAFCNFVNYFKDIIFYSHCVICLISNYFLGKIINKNSIWISRLEKLIKKYNFQFKNNSQLFYNISISYEKIGNILQSVLEKYNKREFIDIYNEIEYLSSNDLNLRYREKIHKNINENGSIFASSNFIRENKLLSGAPPISFLDGNKTGKYTLVLDLDETLVHFKVNVEKESSGLLLLRPFLYEFLRDVKKYYELILFTAGTQEYADEIISHIESKGKIFDYKLYRMHTVVVENDFVKDLSKLNRDLSKIIIVDNMKQNYKLQPDNGINIRPFWGKDPDDTALKELSTILINIAENKMDVRYGIKYYKEDIISKVTSNISKRII